MKFYSSLIIAIFFISIINIDAQPLIASTLEMKLEEAANQIELNNYYNALELYEEAYKEQKDYDVAVEIAYLHYKLRNYKRAESWYSRVFKRDKENYYAEDKFLYAKTLKAMGKFQEARDVFQQFVKDTEDPEAREMAKLELQGIEASRSMEDNIEAVIAFAGKKINSGQTEYAPRLYDGKTLYYSAIKGNSLIETEGFNDEQYSRIYSASIDKGELSKPQDLGDFINRPGFHTGNPAFSPDGRKMYFTRAQLEGNELIESKLFISYKTEEGWKPPVELSTLNGDFIVKHPVVGELYGNQVLYFVSDMDGGKGGFDIYYANMEGDEGFASPVNLGDKINTKYDEVSPFYADGVLYFSTDGRPGLGGYDIFKTEWDGSQWSDASNLGFNYNTTYDDLFFFLNNGGSKGYLVSNRPDDKKRNLKSKTCCDDIYSIDIRDIVIDLDLYVEDENGPLNGPEGKLVDLSGAREPDIKGNSLGNNLKFLLDGDRSYSVAVKRDGYVSDTIEFNTAGLVEDHTIRKTVVLVKEPEVVVVKDPEPEVEIVEINEAIRLSNIYYDFDDWKILPDAEQDLNTLLGLMNKYSDMVIELSSHTDSRGGGRYNKELSQKRAESAKKYLTKKGVSKKRIVAKGYGEARIINQCKNNVDCSEDEHRFNRRTEFKILEGPQTIEIIREKPVERYDNVDFNGGGAQSFGGDPAPIIKFDAEMIEVGDMQEGMYLELVYNFTNVGDSDLVIELVTACKCTDIRWTMDSVAPGERGEIFVQFDSKGFMGEVNKTIDIISNTDPMVQEVKFKVNVLPAK